MLAGEEVGSNRLAEVNRQRRMLDMENALGLAEVQNPTLAAIRSLRVVPLRAEARYYPLPDLLRPALCTSSVCFSSIL